MKNYHHIFVILIITFFFYSVQASEKDLYNFLWLDPDKKVFVLQNKVYKKKNTRYLNVSYLYELSSFYQDISGFQGALGYYFHEEWGIEAFYHQYASVHNSNYEQLKVRNNTVPFARITDRKIGAILLWVPFYGKINTFNKILYFDWLFGVGGGRIQGRDNAKTVQNPRTPDQYEVQDYMGLMMKTALRLYFSRKFYSTLEFHLDLYNARDIIPEQEELGETLISGGDVIFGMGMHF